MRVNLACYARGHNPGMDTLIFSEQFAVGSARRSLYRSAVVQQVDIDLAGRALIVSD